MTKSQPSSSDRIESHRQEAKTGMKPTVEQVENLINKWEQKEERRRENQSFEVTPDEMVQAFSLWTSAYKVKPPLPEHSWPVRAVAEQMSAEAEFARVSRAVAPLIPSTGIAHVTNGKTYVIGRSPDDHFKLQIVSAETLI